MTITVDGSEYSAGTNKTFIIPVKASDDWARFDGLKDENGQNKYGPGKPPFWCQHPYKGAFGPAYVTFPVSEGSHVIRVETSKNAAGNTGFDEVAVTLEKRQIPGTGSSEADTAGPAAVLSLYFPQAPTPQQADTLQYFRGEREPAPDDPSLTETQADSLALAGQINGLQTEITLLNFVGLTAQADTLTARISYTIKGVQTGQDLTLTETGPETRLFRFRFADPTPESLKANIYLPGSPKQWGRSPNA
ncbi:MAG: hypothetical protein FJ290_08185 [Planctomycetes bacterium]|nr:hypothetical protein [Planctomycetota bacterium]